MWDASWLTQAQLAGLEAGLAAGKSVRQIALELGAHYRACLVVSAERGWRSRERSRLGQAQIGQVLDLVQAGWTDTQIGALFKVNASVVYKLRVRAGVHTQRSWDEYRGMRRRCVYLQARLDGHSRKAAAVIAQVSDEAALRYERGVTIVTNPRRHIPFMPTGLLTKRYNDLMAATTHLRTVEPITLDWPDQPSPGTTPRGRYLSLTERNRIADMRLRGCGVRHIARTLGRSPGTISKELRRNQAPDGTYGPNLAQHLAQSRRPRPKPSKLVTNTRLRQYVIDGLKNHWSPAQIANRIRLDFPDDPAMRVSMETIYDAFYLKARGNLKALGLTLPTQRNQRSHRYSPSRSSARLKTPSIDERPDHINDRAIPGAWEGDLILGTRCRSAIITLVERTTLFTILIPVGPTHDAATVRDCLIEGVKHLDKRIITSITWDQGGEMALHHQFTTATNITVYFAHPTSPWERAINENTNGRIRRFIPKSTDLNQYTQTDLDHIAAIMNNTPRKTLGWLKPNEALTNTLNSLQETKHCFHDH